MSVLISWLIILELVIALGTVHGKRSVFVLIFWEFKKSKTICMFWLPIFVSISNRAFIKNKKVNLYPYYLLSLLIRSTQRGSSLCFHLLTKSNNSKVFMILTSQ